MYGENVPVSSIKANLSLAAAALASVYTASFPASAFDFVSLTMKYYALSLLLYIIAEKIRLSIVFLQFISHISK